MPKYHITNENEPKPCTATAGRCRYNLAEADHFTSLAAAHEYVNRDAATVVAPLSKKGLLAAQRRAIHSSAVLLMESIDEQPDWLPPVDDPNITSSIDMDEEEGYISSMSAFTDPKTAAGNCVIVADTLKEYSALSGDDVMKLGYIDREVGGPYLNFHAANTFTDDSGREWVVDYTYSQIDPDAEFPYVAERADWERAVDAAGYVQLSQLVSGENSFEVEDNWGDKSEMIGGELNEDSRFLFRNGQCLALASELAKRFDSDKLAMVSVELYSEELDDDGEAITYPSPVHFYAVHEDGTLWDVDGSNDADIAKEIAEDNGNNLSYLSVEEAQAGFSVDLSEQHYDYAATMVDPVIKLNEERIVAA